MNLKSLKKIILFLPAYITFFLPSFVFSANPAFSGEIENPIGVDTLNEFVQKILEGVIKLGMPLIALAVIYSGFLFVTAQGNAGELEKAKKALLYTLVGAVLLLGSWAIAILLSETVLQFN